MSSVDTRHNYGGDRFSAGLEVAGLKVTAQRRAICQTLNAMRTAGHHPTSREVYEAARKHQPSVSLATAYNTLAALRDLGLVHELGATGDGALHYELDTGPHLNLLCTRCKQIFDFPAAALTGLDKEIARKSGFELLGAQLLYYGVCPDCQRVPLPRA